MSRGLDKLFGGAPGAAQAALKSMQRTYGRTRGKQVFDATVIRRKHKAKRQEKKR